jgi:thymidine phosphorylase
MIEAKIGDPVERGQPLATVAYRDESKLDDALPVVTSAWTISDSQPEPPELVIGRIT